MGKAEKATRWIASKDARMATRGAISADLWDDTVDATWRTTSVVTINRVAYDALNEVCDKEIIF